MADLHKSLRMFKNPIGAKKFPGSLGLTQDTVNVPNRPGYSYVRLLGNTSELIQAYNTTVYPAYDLPVEVQWDGTKYVVIGRDINRYTSWGNSPYLPLHGSTHEWNGGDTTWILSEQFYPLSVSPSGSSLYIAPYSYNWQGAWVSAGNTGTNTITLPSDDTKQSIMLLYLNGTTGNPSWLAGTEAPLYTDRNLLLPYLPTFMTSSGIPLAMVRIPSGTTSFSWDMLYDVRQFFGGGSGGGLISGSFGNVLGPASSVDGDIVVFDGTTGKIIKDGGALAKLYVDQAGGTSPTYGTLVGARNGVNTTFVVSHGAYTSGNLTVYLNGKLLTQTNDWSETVPASGSFHLVEPPSSSDIIMAIYGSLATGGGSSGATSPALNVYMATMFI